MTVCLGMETSISYGYNGEQSYSYSLRCQFPTDTLTKESHIATLYRNPRDSDASEYAFAAVVYIHTTETSNHARVSLVMSKGRVASIKGLTIPRLELYMWSAVVSSTPPPRQTST